MRTQSDDSSLSKSSELSVSSLVQIVNQAVNQAFSNRMNGSQMSLQRNNCHSKRLSLLKEFDREDFEAFLSSKDFISSMDVHIEAFAPFIADLR